MLGTMGYHYQFGAAAIGFRYVIIVTHWEGKGQLD